MTYKEKKKLFTLLEGLRAEANIEAVKAADNAEVLKEYYWTGVQAGVVMSVMEVEKKL